ncbi:MAG: type II toxin-antitoxin system VapC family toxin [Rhodanobacter sp.]|jgi:predicted nucleic acid-binding protein|nr:type II toxin-antitoxin system VapC family toxin [Rhodanobacter sp.]
MSQVLVDANVLLDILTNDPVWFDWSSLALENCAASLQPCVNPLIYAEVSVGFERIEELDAALPPGNFTRLPLPWEAGFLAGKVFLRYRHAGGARHSPLPDFYIGAHAAIARLPLLTRDAARYRAYFPTVRLICPQTV